jgi:large subunit ribosomal protein LP2
MKEMATYLMLVLGGNASPSKDDITKALSSVGVEADDSKLSTLLSSLEGKDLTELLELGTSRLAKFGGGGGGGGGGGAAAGGAAAEEAAEEEKPEEEEADLGGGDLFGGEGGGGGGDY